MKRKHFSEFIDKKSREGKRQLAIIREVLQKGGLKVVDFSHTEDEDPYIFVYNTQSNDSFHGLRLYKIGDSIAFRIQREEKTHPYGSAYSYKVSDMFNDLVEDMNEEHAGKKVMEYMVKEIQRFFLLSSRADAEMRSADLSGSGDPMGRLIIQSTGTEFSRGIGGSS